MKRIIAAALSVLVGAFGYTIVDQAVEDRVTSLESEVIELREEVSRYHPQYSEHGTTHPRTESTTRNKVTTTKGTTTTKIVESTQPFAIGSYLTESDDSLHKFLIREYTNGRFSYISHNSYEPVSFVEKPIVTTKPITTKPTTTRPTTTKPITNGTTTNVIDGILGMLTTTSVAPVAEYYINITESSAQITDITEEVSYKYSYDKDYSSVSNPISKTATQITVLCKGYTDSALAGKRIILFTDISNFWPVFGLSVKEVVSNTINSDGSFEYKVVYSTTEQLNHNTQYSFSHIEIK